MGGFGGAGGYTGGLEGITSFPSGGNLHDELTFGLAIVGATQSTFDIGGTNVVVERHGAEITTKPTILPKLNPPRIPQQFLSSLHATRGPSVGSSRLVAYQGWSTGFFVPDWYNPPQRLISRYYPGVTIQRPLGLHVAPHQPPPPHVAPPPAPGPPPPTAPVQSPTFLLQLWQNLIRALPKFGLEVKAVLQIGKCALLPWPDDVLCMGEVLIKHQIGTILFSTIERIIILTANLTTYSQKAAQSLIKGWTKQYIAQVEDP
jgi:hypothetical protein